ncbi:MAG: hypothetical protein ACI9W6_002803, partial [Motiliproteus sp.]
MSKPHSSLSVFIVDDHEGAFRDALSWL